MSMSGAASPQYFLLAAGDVDEQVTLGPTMVHGWTMKAGSTMTITDGDPAGPPGSFTPVTDHVSEDAKFDDPIEIKQQLFARCPGGGTIYFGYQ